MYVDLEFRQQNANADVCTADARTLCTSIQDVYDPCPAVSKLLSKTATKNNVGLSYRKFIVEPSGPVIVFGKDF